MPIEDDVESCGSRATDFSSSHVNPRHHRQKLEVYNEVLRRIQQSNFHEANLPGFDDQLWLHFNRLPARYLPCPSSSLVDCMLISLLPHCAVWLMISNIFTNSLSPPWNKYIFFFNLYALRACLE